MRKSASHHVNIDYVEGDPGSYRGVVISVLEGRERREALRWNTGNPEQDWSTYLDWKAGFEGYVLEGSSITHFLWDVPGWMMILDERNREIIVPDPDDKRQNEGKPEMEKVNMNEIGPRDALIVIDVQNDFLPGGNLAVPEGDRIMGALEEAAVKFGTIVLTQDWHPADHSSFASSHDRKVPFQTIELPYGAQVLWPQHCVQGEDGAEFDLHPDILKAAQLIIRKGMNPEIDSYSAFMENDRKTTTGLAAWLKERGIERVWFAGLALDYCVAYSALDARDAGFEAVVILDACRGISDDTVTSQVEAMKDAGVLFA